MKENSLHRDEILSLFPVPLYTGSRIYFEGDLEEEGVTEVLKGLPQDTSKTVLEHARTLASLKPELALHFLWNVRQMLDFISLEELKTWVHKCLEVYDTGGLHSAREFVTNFRDHPKSMAGRAHRVLFQDVSGVLLNWLHGLGGEAVSLDTKPEHYTDTASIYLPEEVSVFSSRESNFLLYQLMVTHKYLQIRLGTYSGRCTEAIRPLVDSLRQRYGRTPSDTLESDLSRFIHLFPSPELAADIFMLLDTIRVEQWIAENLPGLHRKLETIKRHFSQMRERPECLSDSSGAMEMLTLWHLKGMPAVFSGAKEPTLNRILPQIEETARAGAMRLKDVAEFTAAVYSTVNRIPGSYEPVEKIPYIGLLKAEEAERGRKRRRESRRLGFKKELTKLLEGLPDKTEDIRIELDDSEDARHAGDTTPQRQAVPDHLFVGDHPVPIPEAMQKIIREIYEDLGKIPSSYLAVADDMTGHYFHSLCHMPEGTGYFLSENAPDVHVFDEWDFRRQGYRKRWALLREMPAEEGDMDFCEQTRSRFGGMVKTIKRHFERLRLEESWLRRQREGEEIDLDAGIAAMADFRAGLAPSDRVFMRRNRDKRDIAAAFLVDLSGSTSGWINEMERISLLILVEAMKVLKDRFAIYGFSGQTRKRCELYKVKGFDECYDDRVKRRISGLRAREYTRMGPPIRRLTDVLSGMDCRTRLLITLSDGKPDDYDGYSGDYGIEDTRRALLDARLRGILPFCITIDRAEHSYLSHMYGPANYVFIDDIAKLPTRIPGIYRKLTA